jgi:hypothetical protein
MSKQQSKQQSKQTTISNQQTTNSTPTSRWPEIKERDVKVETPLGIDKGMHLRMFGQKEPKRSVVDA